VSEQRLPRGLFGADGRACLFIAFAARDSRDCVQSFPSHPFPGRE
jgi:hypothetical protein